MRIVPCTLKQANAFVAMHHRHNNPSVGHKFSIGVVDDSDNLLGVAIAGRPIARMFDDGITLEVTRTCTTGARNANSMLYGAVRAAAFAMGYRRVITYTQHGESGASLAGAGFVRAGIRPARRSWYESSTGEHKEGRDPVGTGGVERTLWEARR